MKYRSSKYLELEEQSNEYEVSGWAFVYLYPNIFSREYKSN
ncbi:hypothetical protein SBF1_1300002 [Candidatus Desulfosporosinus infrequens]|uniref:Uncharacterized protein n=1 Tax=Candidatus Desulfosporosinus infrequens TaxID=2043169 RepID=A0A2U3K409_9FIRM|nr:hypothetical protein SBF1_1300002 [Candidatus Desulfosporosinus infrequens]